MNEKTYKYKVTDPEIAKFLIDYAHRKGRQELIPHYCKNFHFFILDGIHFCFAEEGSQREMESYNISFEDLLKALSKPVFIPRLFNLNNEYTGEIQENGDFKIKCQTFSAEAILELASKIKEIREKYIAKTAFVEKRGI